MFYRVLRKMAGFITVFLLLFGQLFPLVLAQEATSSTKYGSISGYKFIDWDGDGIWDDDEWAENDWLITLNGPNDMNEEAWTGEIDEGSYIFENLLPGTYRICEDIAYSTDNFDGWTQTTPLDNSLCPDGTNGYEINLAAGQNITEKNFGNFRKISISGRKFEDMNADGSYDPNDSEHPDRDLSGWTIFIDGNKNGVFDKGEKFAATEDNGSYTLTDVGPGTHRIREASQSGWVQTTTNPDDIEVQSGNDVTGIDFGNFKKVIIDIFKWKDLDADGEWDKGEPPIAGWDMKVEGLPPIEETEIIYGGLRILPTNEDGHALPEVDKPGTYRITEGTDDNFQRTYPGDSFFDIFVEFSGQTTEGETSITKDKNSTPLRFGNAPFYQLDGAKFVPSGDASSSASLLVLDDSTINVPSGGGTSSISLPANTIITKSGGGTIDASQLAADAPTIGALTGFGANTVVDGALQWGVPNLGLEFSNPITLNIFVGTSFNGQTLNVLRSTTGSSGWTADGIVAPATCVVTNGICTFQATKASYYATTHTTSATSAPASSSSSSTNTSDGGGSSSAPSCNDAAPGGAPTLLSAIPSGPNSVTLTWSAAKDPLTHYVAVYGLIPGVPLYGNPNVGGKGTTSYTVSNLSGGVTYYFKVRAGNGCNGGPYSNEIAAGSGGAAVSGPAAGFASGVLGVSTDKEENVGAGELGEVKGEAATSSQPSEPSEQPLTQAKTANPFNVKVALVVIMFLLGGFALFRFFK